MLAVIQGLFAPDTLFDPIGVELGNNVRPFLIGFGVVFALGVIVRALVAFGKMNPFLKKWLRQLAFVLMFFGIFEVLYFLIREQGVAYITANIVFVVSFALFVLWIIYHVAYRFFFVYRKERAFYELEMEHKKYLPGKKR